MQVPTLLVLVLLGVDTCRIQRGFDTKTCPKPDQTGFNDSGTSFLGIRNLASRSSPLVFFRLYFRLSFPSPFHDRCSGWFESSRKLPTIELGVTLGHRAPSDLLQPHLQPNLLPRERRGRAP